MLQAQPLYSSGSPCSLFLIVSTPASSYHLTKEIISLVTWQPGLVSETQQAGSTSPFPTVMGAIFVYADEQTEYSDFIAFHSPWKAIY